MPAPGHVIAIDREHVRYAYFARDNGELSFREFHSEELGDSAFHDGPFGGPVRDIDRFAQAVGSLVERIPQGPHEASLVLPDQWLRVAFTEIEEFPRGTPREDVLRFKLRRMVPFRVEDLRVSSVEVPALDGSGGERRYLLGFGLEILLAQLEATLDQYGVRIGQVSNEGLSLLPVMQPILGGGVSAVVHVTPGSYTLIVTQSGQPVLHRFKTLPEDPETRARLVPRELRLTRDYLRQEAKGRRLSELILAAPAQEQDSWKHWVEDAFEHPVRAMGDEWPELPGSVVGVPSWHVAPLLGAATRGIY